jgi:hypothetical protein
MSQAPIQRYLKLTNGGNGDYWFDALGWVSYFFAQLEWSSYAVIDRLGNATDKSLVTGQGFKPRTQRAAALVDTRLATSDPDLALEWSTFWKGVIDSAPKRNAILHNPLTVNLHGMQSVGETEGIKMMKRQGMPLLELGEVQAYADELRKLNVLMLDLFDRTTFQ